MTKLSHREHARLAAELIEDCGGPSEAARACRVNKSTLSTYQNPHETATMPADVMADLERYANKGPTYSGAIAAVAALPNVTGCLKELACDLAEQSIDVQAAVRKALADNVLTPREMDTIAAAERDAETALERLRGARLAIEAAADKPGLRAA